jgi:HSP20 family protein
MAATATAKTGPQTIPIDRTIERLEHLYRQVTGSEPPPTNGDASIPPERQPGEYVDAQIDRLMDLLGRAPAPFAARSWMPPISLAEQSDGVIVSADLPGVRRDDLHVSVSGNVLEIAGWRGSEDDGRLRHDERARGAFRRLIPLPEVADPARVSARFLDGVLVVRVTQAPRPSHTVDVD